MLNRKIKQRQDSQGTHAEFSPRVILHSDEAYKGEFAIHPISNKLEFPQISTPKASTLNFNNEYISQRISQDNRKKRFFLAKKVNPSQLNEMANPSSPYSSSQQLQVVNINQLHHRKISNHSSPLVTPRNSALSIAEKPKEDIKINIMDLHGDFSPSVQMSNSQQEVPLPVLKEKNTSIKKTAEPLPLPQEFQEKSLRKNQSFNSQSVMSGGLKQQNIFNLKTANFDQKGPRYDELGNIVQRSLVGKPEWFQKKDGSTLDRDRLKEIVGNKKNSQLRKQSSFSTLSKQKSENKSKNKYKHMSNKVTKRQLLDQIDVIRDRIKTNRQKEETELGSMQIDQKMQTTRDQRIMDKHEENEYLWQKFVEKSSNSLNRDFVYSQLVRNEQYRNMKEATEVFNLCQSDLERYGSKLWEMTLRKKGFKKLNLFNELERDEPPDLIITTDLPQAFQCSSLAGERKILQFIKKPIITDLVAGLMNSTMESNGFQSTHQRLLQLKTLGENMYNMSGNNIGSQNLSSVIEDQTLNDQTDFNTSIIQQDNTSTLQNNNQSQIQEKLYQQNVSSLNQSKFNNSILNSPLNKQGGYSDITKTMQSNENTQMTKRQHTNSLPTLKQSINIQKPNTLNQSNMSFMNSTFQVAQSLQQPFKSFGASQYYNKRIDEIKNLVKDYKTIYEQNVEYQGLAVRIFLNNFDNQSNYYLLIKYRLLERVSLTEKLIWSKDKMNTPSFTNTKKRKVKNPKTMIFFDLQYLLTNQTNHSLKLVIISHNNDTFHIHINVTYFNLVFIKSLQLILKIINIFFKTPKQDFDCLLI